MDRSWRRGRRERGTIQLIADVAHLLAAAAWIGALFGLGAMVFAGDDPKKAHRALESFSRIGTLVVGLVIASGLFNLLYLVGVQHLADLSATLYGQLLIVKLLLFAALLGLAALNRFRLTPALGCAKGEPPSFAMLRMSLTFEAGAATAILGLVAWLGTLEPPMSM